MHVLLLPDARGLVPRSGRKSRGAYKLDSRFRGNDGLVHTVGNDGIGRIRLSDLITIISAHSASAYAVRFPVPRPRLCEILMRPKTLDSGSGKP